MQLNTIAENGINGLLPFTPYSEIKKTSNIDFVILKSAAEGLSELVTGLAPSKSPSIHAGCCGVIVGDGCPAQD